MFKKYVQMMLVVLLLTQLSSCITARRVNYLQKPGKIIPSYQNNQVYEDYKLKKGDKLYIRVFSTDKESNYIFGGGDQAGNMMFQGNNSYTDLYSYNIQTDGTIQFPMLSNVYLAGMTVREATNTLESALQPIFKFSTVELRVIGRSFSVIGGGKTGQYPIIREKVNIFQALAMAGDIGLFGDRAHLRIIRETDKGTIVKTFDIRSKDILHSEFYYVEPNDVIYIQSLDEQFFSILNLPSLFATTVSTISFAAFLYQLVFPVK